MKNRRYPSKTLSRSRPGDLRAFARHHLLRYGYLTPCKHPEGSMCEHLEAALYNFQSFARIAPTARLSVETVKLMSTPRCGVPDPVPAVNGLRAARATDGDPNSDPFTYFGGAWRKRHLTWFLDNGTDDNEVEESTIQRAFDCWAEHVPLTFEKVDDPEADIFVGFTLNDPIDGTIAFAIHWGDPDAPGVQSRVIFDDAEVDWSDEVLFLGTAIHEIGHVLGLDHSGNPEAIMFAFENGTSALHEDDVRGIRSRYPTVLPSNHPNFVQASLFALGPRFTGTQAKTIDLGSPRRLVAWGQVTAADALIMFDQDNGYAVEVFEVDGQRCPGEQHFGGDHFGSEGGPANVSTGAWTGVAQRITFRIRSTHVSDFEVFGTGNIIILE